jgi:hypothetical protein
MVIFSFKAVLIFKILVLWCITALENLLNSTFRWLHTASEKKLPTRALKPPTSAVAHRHIMPNPVTCKCDTAQHYIFNILNMKTTLKKLNLMQ